MSHPSELDGCHALFHYASPLDKLIPAFKYQERLDIGHCLASLLATEVACWYREHPHPDLIVPVPMHYRRYLRRGFNQSWELCKVIGNTTSLRCSEFSLRKVRHTAAQSDLASARARASNLQNAFEVTRKSALQNVKSVTIIDDVVTTMSTVSTLARLLKGHGIQRVEAWCVARAGIGQNQA